MVDSDQNEEVVILSSNENEPECENLNVSQNMPCYLPSSKLEGVTVTATAPTKVTTTATATSMNTITPAATENKTENVIVEEGVWNQKEGKTLLPCYPTKDPKASDMCADITNAAIGVTILTGQCRVPCYEQQHKADVPSAHMTDTGLVTEHNIPPESRAWH